ncbi:MAG: invertase recombinase-like protein [Myxococcales bacterium]|nr:invertase recombinase-like protein [Myxococcales bacterium]
MKKTWLALSCLALALIVGGCGGSSSTSEGDLASDTQVADTYNGDSAVDGGYDGVSPDLQFPPDSADATPDSTGEDGSDAPSPDVLDDATTSDAIDDATADSTDDATSDGLDDATSDAIDDATADSADDATGSDAGDLGGDVFVPQPSDNVIPNGDFELWSDDLPNSWLGEQNNISSDQVSRSQSGVHGGSSALVLANNSDAHKRFTTAGLSLLGGRYQCTYWVKGKGEIRNAYYDGDFSSYKPAGYYQIDTTEWQQISYSFFLAADTNGTFELIFSVRNTDSAAGDLQIDDVFCYREPNLCDTLVCESWETCDLAQPQCKPNSGYCSSDTNCFTYEECKPDHICGLKAGRCYGTADCDVNGATPKCDLSTHTCVAGDPCGDVSCSDWKSCDPSDGKCKLQTDRCDTTFDCTGQKTACDTSTHTCEATEHSSNIVPNGGFESWSVYDIPFYGEHLIPDDWYGLDIPGSTEIDPQYIVQITSGAHSGSYACQLIDADIADRFTTEAFDVPTGTYSCSYYVRGHGSIRHRWYSLAGWSKFFPEIDVDTDQWQRVTFKINGNVTQFRFIFYASYTQADKGHIQLDSIVCTKD